MPIHIGVIIKEHVEKQKLKFEEFGALIGKDLDAVSEIFKCPDIDIDLLVSISKVLQIDLLQVYYQEDPLKSLREEELKNLQQQLKEFTEKEEELKTKLRPFRN